LKYNIYRFFKIDNVLGNSSFAEEDRQTLLNEIKVLSNKYNKAKQELETKMIEIELLKAEKFGISTKWEIDQMYTLQELDFINKCKSEISDLRYKLKAEMKKNDQVEEMRSKDDSFK